MSRRSEAVDPILFLSPEAPYPLAGGGAMRTACLLQFLSEVAPIHLIVFAEEGSADPREAIPEGLVERSDVVWLPIHRKDIVSKCVRNLSRLARGRPPLFDRFSTPESQRKVADLIRGERYSLAVVEHFWCADYLPVVRPAAERTVLDLHNIESALHATCAETEPFPQNWAHRRFAYHSRRLEARLLGGYDVVLVPSEVDAGRVRAVAPDADAAVVPNAIPLTSPASAPERELIAFSGNLEYHPNVTAVRFFASQVWPGLRRKFPNLVWRLIGKNESAFRALAEDDPRIELSGPVEDALAELTQARVVVAPILAGSGTRVKIMEAWAAARPVVSTPIGAEGLPYEEGRNLLLAETPNRWLEQTSRLLEEEALRRNLGANGRNTFEQHCCWPAAWRVLDEALTLPRSGVAAGDAV